MRPFPLPLQIGTDICHIPRILRILQGSRGQAFVRRVLRVEERVGSGVEEAVRGWGEVREKRGNWRAEARKDEDIKPLSPNSRTDGLIAKSKVLRAAAEQEQSRSEAYPNQHDRFLRRSLESGGLDVVAGEGVEKGVNVVGDGILDGSTSASGVLAKLDGMRNRDTEDRGIITSSDAHKSQPAIEASNTSALEALSGNHISGSPDTNATTDTPKSQLTSKAPPQPSTEISSHISAERKERKGKQSRLLNQSPRRRRMLFLREAAKQSHLASQQRESATTAAITITPATLEPIVRELAEKLVREIIQKTLPSKPTTAPNPINPQPPSLPSPSPLDPDLLSADAALHRAAQFLAGRFAAKEAIVKAHRRRRLTFQDISIVRGAPKEGETGSVAPVAVVLDEGCREGEEREVRVSISHDGEWAIACCLAVEVG